MQTKKWWQSRTNWFNILTFAVGAIGDITKTIPMTAETAKIFGYILISGNLLLRQITSKSIEPIWPSKQ